MRQKNCPNPSAFGHARNMRALSTDPSVGTQRSILRLIVSFRRQMMMMTPVFLPVGIIRKSCPAPDWEEQANTRSTKDRYDADEYGNRHAKKHPNKTDSIVALVDVPQSRHNAEQRCDFIMRMLLFFAEWH